MTTGVLILVSTMWRRLFLARRFTLLRQWWIVWAMILWIDGGPRVVVAVMVLLGVWGCRGTMVPMGSDSPPLPPDDVTECCGGRCVMDWDSTVVLGVG